MCRCMQTLVLVVAALQLLHVAVAQEDDEDYDLDALLGESRRRMEFFKEICKFSKDLNIQNTETKCKLETNELKSQADGLQLTIEQMKLNQRSAEQAETQCRGELSEKLNNFTGLQKAEQKICAENHHLLRVAHLATTDVALKSMNRSLQFFAHREQELKIEAANSGELADILQIKLAGLSNITEDGAYEESTFAEKVRLENELIGVKSRIIQLNSQLEDLKNEENSTSFYFHQMLEQKKQLKASISQRTQHISSGNFQTNLIKQLERLHETLEMERKHFKIQLQTLTNLKESELAQVELLMNFTCFEQIYIANKKLKEASEQNQNLDLKLKSAQQQEHELKSNLSDAKSQLSDKESNLVSCNTQLSTKKSNLASCQKELNIIKSVESTLLEQENCRDNGSFTVTGLDSKQYHIQTKLNTTQASCRNNGGLTMTNLNGRQYYLHAESNNRKTWYEANDFCKRHCMELVTFETREEQTAVAQKMKSYTSTKYHSFWIGLNDLAKEGEFRWISNGEIPSFTNWYNGEPNNSNDDLVENCVELKYSGDDIKWNDGVCEHKRIFTCESQQNR